MNERQRATAKRYVDIWKQTGPELDRIKWEELREMTEEDRLAQASSVLETGSRWLAGNPAFDRPCGLVEQQRVFSKWRLRAR